MRRPLVRIVILFAGTAAIAAGIGCGSNGPTAPSSQQLASHFDSLYVAAILRGTKGDSLRSTVLTYLELATAEGALPVPVTVTTASGTEKWEAISFEIADTSGNPSASTIAATIVYSDNSVTNSVFSEVTTGSGARQFAEMVAADTIYAASTSATALATVTNTGKCALPSPSGYSNPIFSTVATMYHCNLVTVLASLNASFPSTPGIDSSLLSISFASVKSNGVRLADATP
jgi:hypothetical protein